MCDFASEFLDGYRYVGYWNQGKGKKVSGNQYKVYSTNEVTNLMELHNGINNCGISITTFKDGTPYLLYLPFDFDSPNLRTAWNDASKLFNFLSKLGYEVMINFTGSKGFHVLVKVIPATYTKNQIRFMQKFIKRYLKLDTCDDQIMGDVRRLIRLPGTYHMNGCLCETICQNKGKLLDISKFTTADISTLKSIGNNAPIKTEDLKIKHDYPCVEWYVRAKDYWIKNHIRNSFEPSHKIRFAWAILRIAEKKTDDEIVAEAKAIGWWDFDEYKMRYQLYQIRSIGYVNPSCETLKQDGYCTIVNCPHLKWEAISITKWRKHEKAKKMRSVQQK